MSQPALLEFRRAFVSALAEALSLPAAEVDALVKPAEGGRGDFAFPTFSLAKQLKKAPPAIAAETASKLQVPGLQVLAQGPYLNATIDPALLLALTLAAIRSQGSVYGGSAAGRGQTIVLDYSSPNIAKPIAFHHIRSTVIGHSVANLHRACGYEVHGINYLGDWGKQFGLVAVGFQAFGDPSKIEDMGHLVEVYVKANERAAADPDFDEQARSFFRRMEAGDPEALATWKQFRESSVAEFKKIYARLGIAFEHYEGESFYQGKMDAVIAEISKTLGTKESDGALIVDLPYAENEPPVLLKKNDGSTLYATRDFAAAIDRFERFHFARSLYIVATDQSLHFRQVFGVLEKLGKPWAKDLLHVNFGRVHGMATRKGKITLLNDVLDEAKHRALEKVQENVAAGRIHTDNADLLAEQIGVGAIVFGDLKNRRTTDYEFSWDDILNFEGHTGVYVQYAHARACNILDKGGGAPNAADLRLLSLPEEFALAKELARLPLVVQDAMEQCEPSFVARYLLDVSASFSKWYTLGNQDREKRVLIEGNEPLQQARLALTDAVRTVLCNGLALLGIASPEKM